MQIFQNYSLLKYNTFNLDVKTKYFVEYESEEDLQKLLNDEYFLSESFWHIGQGSNLLFLGNYNGIIVHSGIKGIEMLTQDENSVYLKVGASEDWDSFVQYCVDKGWGGLENLSGIPGEVGSSAFQNIGAYGAEVSNSITEVHTYSLETGEKRIFSKEECDYSYRHSFFKEKENRGLYYITYVVFRLDKQPKFCLDYGNLKERLQGKEITLQNVREAVLAIRDEKLPNPEILGNAGSFFMNPYICMEHFDALKKNYPDMPYYPVDGKVVKIPAAWLIEQCGMKGKSIGGAAVYEKQPLVLINKNHASGEDIALLAEEIQNAVKDKFSIELQPEVNFI